jgi:hypothetical protein
VDKGERQERRLRLAVSTARPAMTARFVMKLGINLRIMLNIARPTTTNRDDRIKE